VQPTLYLAVEFLAERRASSTAASCLGVKSSRLIM
jgi:hypothetical protein